MNAARVLLLDTTLRDGGLGLEDAHKNGISSCVFDDVFIHNAVQNLQKSNVDIVELGSIEITQSDMRHFAIYQDIESVSKIIPDNRNENQLFVALFRGPDTPIEKIPEWKPCYCDGIRVILRYSELEKSLDFCKALSQKGYRVFVQPMLTMRYSEDELNKVIAASNEMGAYATYFVDSYGYMEDEDVIRLFEKYDATLSPNIKIGFHAHNNMNLAFANTKTFLEQRTNREVIVDSCAMGIGQGAGNLQTEIIADYLNRKMHHTYQLDAILDLCESVEKFWTDNIWGYSAVRFLPARHKAAYKYAIAMRHQYGMSLKEIDRVFNSMPLDLRQRYTPQNLQQALQMKSLQEECSCAQ